MELVCKLASAAWWALLSASAGPDCRLCFLPLLVLTAGWAAVDLALWCALLWVEAHVAPVSRRLCNLAFILWVCAFCGALLLPLLLAQVRERARPQVASLCSHMVPHRAPVSKPWGPGLGAGTDAGKVVRIAWLG